MTSLPTYSTEGREVTLSLRILPAIFETKEHTILADCLSVTYA